MYTIYLILYFRSVDYGLAIKIKSNKKKNYRIFKTKLNATTRKLDPR